MGSLRLPPTIRRLQQIGLLGGVDHDEAWRIHDTAGRDAPAGAVLGLYYAADGDAVESLWRRQRDAYVQVGASERPGVVGRAAVHALPQVGPLKMSLTPEALVVANDRHTVTVSQVMRHARLRGRERRVAMAAPRHVVRAINALLAHDDESRRFVELGPAPGRHVFIGLSPAAARDLLEQDATVYRDLAGLYSFTGWDRAVSVRAVG